MNIPMTKIPVQTVIRTYHWYASDLSVHVADETWTFR